MKLEVALFFKELMTVKEIVYIPIYEIDVGVTSISYASGYVNIPPGILAGESVPIANVALIVNVSPFGSEMYYDRGIL
jgi:hypothetical protein